MLKISLKDSFSIFFSLINKREVGCRTETVDFENFKTVENIDSLNLMYGEDCYVY